MIDEPLRRSYDQLLAASRGNETREGCLAPDQIVDLVEHRTPDPERMPQLSHVLSCEHCLREYEILRALKSGAELMAPGRWLRTPAARAAQGVLFAGLVALAAYVVTARLRAPASAVSLIAPAGSVAANAPLVFRWRPVAGAVSYRVEVMDSAGTERYSVFTLDTAEGMPDTVQLTTGATYQWRVRAQMPGGGEIRSSVHRFQTAAP